jgi:RimJ/RimL family protein N-acetyltransferase
MPSCQRHERAHIAVRESRGWHTFAVMRDYLHAKTSDGRGITLRLLKPEDAPRIQQACSDPETIKWLGGDIINERYSIDDARGFVEFMHSQIATGGFMSWAIADTATDDLLGHISLIGLGGELTDTAALGYWAHPGVRNAGIATAAAAAVVNEALTPAAEGGGGLRRMTLRVAVGNVGSQRVAEAVGFQRTGHTRQSDPLIDGTFTDEFTYDLLATDPR